MLRRAARMRSSLMFSHTESRLRMRCCVSGVQKISSCSNGSPEAGQRGEQTGTETTEPEDPTGGGVIRGEPLLRLGSGFKFRHLERAVGGSCGELISPSSATPRLSRECFPRCRSTGVHAVERQQSQLREAQPPLQRLSSRCAPCRIRGHRGTRSQPRTRPSCGEASRRACRATRHVTHRGACCRRTTRQRVHIARR